MAPADGGPDAHRGGFGVRHFAGCDAEATGKLGEAGFIRHGVWSIFSKKL